MEGMVEAVAARLRGGVAEALLRWRELHGDDGGKEGAIPRKNARLFAPLPSRTGDHGSANGPAAPEDVDWRALLRTLCRRYAGELVVEGKLLNGEEIEVHRVARIVDGSLAIVALPRGIVRFLVSCRDAPTARIGSVVAARVDKQHARVVLGDPVSLSLPVVAYRAEMLAVDPTSEHEITSMASVFGFDVRQFVGSTSQRRRPSDQGEEDDGDEDARCANGVITRHATFSDLRGVQRLMEASALSPRKWTSLLTAPRFLARATDSVIEEEDPWSHVALATAQKKLWAQERVVRADALRAKGRLKESLAEYDSAVRLDDAHGEALLRRGQVHTELRQYEDAIRDFERLCELEPTNEAALQGLMRAKGKLGHSKHVAAASFQQRRSRSASRDRVGSRRKSPSRRSGTSEQRGDPDTHESNKQDITLTALEKHRLRRLLEEEARTRKQSRKRSSRHRSKSSRTSSSSEGNDDDDDESSSSESASSRHRKRTSSSRHKKSKKSKKSSSSRDRKKTKKHKKTSHRRRNDDCDTKRYASDSSTSSTTQRRSRSHKKSRRSRSRSRSRQQRATRASSVVATHELPHNEQTDELHPILARKPHRLWN